MIKGMFNKNIRTMKKIFTLLFTLFCLSTYGQEAVLTYSGDLYFIPGKMTKGGEAFLVSVKHDDPPVFTIYDGDFKVVKTFTDPTAGIKYQERIVTLTCLYDIETEDGGDGGGESMRSAISDWTVESDETNDLSTFSNIQSIEIYDDSNNAHSRNLYVSQTLFDDDEDFEYVRKRYAIVPITTKYEDYAKEHSTNVNIDPVSQSWGDEAIDAMMKETGADSYVRVWNEEKGKFVFKLYKHEVYGGLFNEGTEIVSLDGTVKGYLPDISYISSAYNFRGKCYVRGYTSSQNILYLLGNKANEIKEVRRDNAMLSVQKIGSNIVVNNTLDEDQSIMISNMGGQILRNVKATRGKTIIPVGGLLGGVYNITLFEHSCPIKSVKMIIK